jgi:RimJ/RimL family protein N-acetyltransferase
MIYHQEGLLIIRDWQQGDEPFIAHHANNYKIWKNLMNVFPYPYTYDDATSWVAFNIGKSPALNFAIVYDGEPVGSIGLVPDTDVHAKNYSMGYWIGEEYWGKGLATIAAKWLTNYAFANFEIGRLTAAVFEGNEASMQVLLKSGFILEAKLKEAVYKDNKFRDEYIFLYPKH